MSLEIIKCVKTIEKRLEEYMVIFGDGRMGALEVVEELRYFMELVLEPAGWQALWKIPRKKCEEMKITYPVTVFVMVTNVDFKALTATVEILGVQDDIQLNDNEEAQLINLFPTEQQQHPAIDAIAVANHLDKLRFFHHHIWLPWDADADNKEWITTTLVPRMQLYYQLATGKIPHEAAKHIHSLLEEARELGQRIKLLEEKNEDEDDVDENTVCELVQLHKQLALIKSDIEILQYPQFRIPIINKIKQKAEEQSADLRMVFNSGTVDDYIKLLTDAKSMVDPKAVIRIYPSLHCALNMSNPGDTVVLGPGEHNFQNLEALEQGGTIKGLYEPSTTIVTAKATSPVMLQPAGRILYLENLTLNAQSVVTALSVKNGLVQLVRCNIIGTNSKSSIMEGVVLTENGSLEATDCNFNDLGVGILLESGAKAVLNNCSITGCMIGIRLSDDALLTMNHCKVSNCLSYGMKIITSNADKAQCIGSTALLERIQGVKCNDLVVEGNQKGDIFIQQRPEDLLSDEDELY